MANKRKGFADKGSEVQSVAEFVKNRRFEKVWSQIEEWKQLA